MKRYLAATAIALSITAGSAVTAHAVTDPDQVAWTSATKTCATLTDDSTHEWCIVGSTMNARNRAITSDDFSTDDHGNLVLDHATRSLATTVTGPSKASKAVMVKVNAACITVPNHSAKWNGCITGAFADLSGGQYVTSADWFAIRVRKHVGYTFRAYLKHAPRALTGN